MEGVHFHSFRSKNAKNQFYAITPSFKNAVKSRFCRTDSDFCVVFLTKTKVTLRFLLKYMVFDFRQLWVLLLILLKKHHQNWINYV